MQQSAQNPSVLQQPVAEPALDFSSTRLACLLLLHARDTAHSALGKLLPEHTVQRPHGLVDYFWLSMPRESEKGEDRIRVGWLGGEGFLQFLDLEEG